MYLMHLFVLTPVSAALGPRLSAPLAIGATAVAAFTASAAAAVAIRKMPFLGKWLG